jgi:hypothetical protein
MRNKFNMLGNLMGETEDDNDQVSSLRISVLAINFFGLLPKNKGQSLIL